MATRLVLTVLSLAATLSTPALAEDLESCGEARYYPSEYTCYNGETLCPIIFGLLTKSCDGTCYATEMYGCVSGKLRLLPEATGPFTMMAHSTNPSFNGKVVNACGGYLAMGAGARKCTSCRDAPADVDCAAYQNETVLLPDGEMAADLPGGQYWYLNPSDGALMYADSEKSLAGDDVTVYENGLFEYEGAPHYWLACLRTLPGGNVGTARTYRIYAPTKDNLSKSDCVEIKLVASAVADRKQGAYKYD